MGIPRTLSLHESALSPSEYSLYVSIFNDLVDPPDTTVGAREAKAYLRGRFPAVDITSIDKILRVFHPALSSVDQLLEGQFYAAMRLLSHVRDGKEVDPSLVFVQPTESSIAALGNQPQTDSGPKSTSTVSTPAPHNSNNPFTSRTNSTNLVQPPPRKSSNPAGTTTVTGRPFSNSISNSALSSDEGSMPDFIPVYPHSRASSSPVPSVPNPFIARANSIPQSMAIAPSLSQPALPTPNSTTSTVVPPALPPRKPTFLPPPRHASQQPTASSSTAPSPPSRDGSVASASTPKLAARPYKEREPPLKPPKPPMHITASTKPPAQIISPLIKQGLEAANRAQRSAEHGLDKFRTWEIIKTSSNSNVNRVNPPSSGGGGGRERERERASSVSSAEQNGTVKIHSTTRHTRSVSRGPTLDEQMEESPFDTPSNDGPAVSPGSPPLDGVFGFGPSSSLMVASSISAPAAPPAPVRVTRSKSLHLGPSTGGPGSSPPIPPPRRKRPESVQVTPTTPTIMDESPLFTPSPIKSAPWKTNGSPSVQAFEADEDSPFGDGGRTTNNANTNTTVRKRYSAAEYTFGRGSPSSLGLGQAPPTNDHSQSSTASTSASSVTGVAGGAGGHGHGSESVGISGITASHFSTLQRQFQNLQMKTRPGLETARAKMEGKLVPGGYNKWGSERLTGGSGEDSSPSKGDGGGLFMPGYGSPASASAASAGGIVSSGTMRRAATTTNSKRRVGMRGGSEGSDEFEEADEVFSTDDDVRRHGWKPLKG